MNYMLDSPANQLVRQGDICVIYISEHNRYILKIEPDNQLQTKFGVLKATDLLQHPYGTRFECKKGWILPLRLTPELWTQLLPHRTQILYQTDISMILLQLDIKPGSLVVESGTGSGSLSHAILRACLPNGHLYTFDIDESRVRDAQKEFDDHGFQKNVQVTHRNVCEVGYGDHLVGKVDACILDLPKTWEAIEHAHRVMKPDASRLCTFSPCIEQVQQNVAKMIELKFKDIVTMECLLRPLEVKTKSLRLWTGQILDGLTEVDQTRIGNLKNQLHPSKRTKISQEYGVGSETSAEQRTLAVTQDHKNGLGVSELESSSCVATAEALDKALTDPKANFHPQMLPKVSHVHAKQFSETVSHSGYLTFATKRP